MEKISALGNELRQLYYNYLGNYNIIKLRNLHNCTDLYILRDSFLLGDLGFIKALFQSQTFLNPYTYHSTEMCYVKYFMKCQLSSKRLTNQAGRGGGG